MVSSRESIGAPASLLALHVIALGIENSNPSAAAPDREPAASVALVEVDRGVAGRTLGVEAVDTADPRKDDLLSAIARLCDRAGVRPRDLGLVAVSAGPGGYTATRIAVTAAKFITEGTGARCVAVPTARAVARATACAVPCAVVLASKGETAWVTAFDGDREVLAGHLATARDMSAWDVRALVADRFLPAAMAARAEELAIEVVAPRFCARAVVELGLGAAPVDPLDLVPIYPREPEAVTKWRQRSG